MDPEGLLQCPYDKNHMIRPSRFPYHLVKCRENHKDVAKMLATCPFNARHRMPRNELDLHMQTCESKCPLEPLPVVQKAEQFSSWQSPPCEENWEDEESSAAATPFVLNEFGNYQPYSAHETVHEPFPPRSSGWAGNYDWKTATSRDHPAHSNTSGGFRAASNREPDYTDEWPRLLRRTRI